MFEDLMKAMIEATEEEGEIKRRGEAAGLNQCDKDFQALAEKYPDEAKGLRFMIAQKMKPARQAINDILDVLYLLPEFMRIVGMQYAIGLLKGITLAGEDTLKDIMSDIEAKDKPADEQAKAE